MILEACGEYGNGLTRVGYYGNRNVEFSSSGSNSRSLIEVSRRFRESMLVIYPRLAAGFRKCGASLGHNIKQLMLIKVNSFFPIVWLYDSPIFYSSDFLLFY